MHNFMESLHIKTKYERSYAKVGLARAYKNPAFHLKTDGKRGETLR